MPKQLFSAAGHGVEYWQNSAVPDKNATSGHIVSAFNDNRDDFITVSGVVPVSYEGGNMTLYIHWASWTVTTGNVVWSAEFERLAENGNSTTTTTFAAARTVTSPVAAQVGDLKYPIITFTPAQAADIAVGESFRIRLKRPALTNGSDTMVGNANFFKLILNED